MIGVCLLKSKLVARGGETKRIMYMNNSIQHLRPSVDVSIPVHLETVSVPAMLVGVFGLAALSVGLEQALGIRVNWKVQ